MFGDKIHHGWLFLGAGVVAGAAAIYFVYNLKGGSDTTIPTPTAPVKPQPNKLVPDLYDFQDTINHWIDNNPSYRANLNIINTAYNQGEISLDDAIVRTKQLIQIYKDKYAGYILRKESNVV